jgi:drug/metabolite transporter (DMT)-like permease
MALNATAGPVLGIACYQHALAVLPSGIVLPIVATSPVAAMVLAFFIEGEKPSVKAVAGGLLAVAGSIALAKH